MEEMPVRKFLELSSAHMPGPDPGFGPFRVLEDEYGTFLFFWRPISRGEARSVPPWLRTILVFARQCHRDCWCIYFDRDGEIEPKLPIYE
jgi:hypothetical protein